MIHFRKAVLSDVTSIASLHAANWKEHYRGILEDHYLEHEVEADRTRVWEERLRHPNPKMSLILAEKNQKLIGFCCTFFDDHGQYGALLDNLHVVSAYSGQGIGKHLMSKAAEEIKNKGGRQDMYLWVLTQNTSAIGFYEKLEGQRKETVMETELWEQAVEKVRYYWPDVAGLIQHGSNLNK